MKPLGLRFLTVALATTVMATVVVVPARAADMPAPAPAPGYYPPVYPPARYHWTGIYFGGHVGAGLLADTVSQAAPGTLAANARVGPVGIDGGAQAGVNFQFATFVVGAEATWSATNLTGYGSVLNTNPAMIGTERYTSAPLWFSTATGRLGYAANDWLFYVKGGGAWMQIGYTDDFLIGGATQNSQAFSGNRDGYTLGAGLEYGLTENVSARMEYDFFDFGTKTYNYTVTNLVPVSVRSDLHTLVFGLNYRFNWAGGGPVVAK